ncbi:MAG: hypothetical protein IBX68_10520 [Dehalococcoidia bacterium]|nr:hypothetical protein [Dehalococcoidia bacterium]
MQFLDGRGMAFTIESMCMRVLVYSGQKIESWYSVPLSNKLVREGLIVEPEEMAGVIAESVKENDLPKAACVWAIPSSGSATQTLSLPNVKKSKMKDVIAREIKRVMPGADITDYVFWKEMPRGGFQKHQVYTLAVPKTTIQNLVETCKAGKLGLKGIELRPFALTRAVSCKYGVIVHGELDNIEIVIVDKFFPALFRSVPIREINGGAEVASQNLLRELPFTIDYYNRTFADSQIDRDAPVYLSGELALEPGLPLEIASVTAREVVSAECPVEAPPNFPLAQFLTTVGLMLRKKW